MKNQRGITIASLAVYVVIVLIVITILANITASMQKGIRDSGKEGTGIAEINKFNVYFLEEVKKPYNNIQETEQENDSKIVFTSGNSFRYVENDKIIYLNNIKIAEDIEICRFSSQQEENGKTLITVTIRAKDTEQKVMNYVLVNELYIQNFANENDYIKTENSQE